MPQPAVERQPALEQPVPVAVTKLPEEADEVLPQPLLDRIGAYSARPAQVIVH